MYVVLRTDQDPEDEADNDIMGFASGLRMVCTSRFVIPAKARIWNIIKKTLYPQYH